MEWDTVAVKLNKNVCVIKFNRPQAKNCINDRMVEEINEAIELYKDRCNVIVLEGDEQYFCFGADFNAIGENIDRQVQKQSNPAKLFDLWFKIANIPCVVISHVKGRVNAGGMGFIGVSDFVIADTDSIFSLSELLFGLIPAMVLPFLIRKVGYSKANFLTLTTKPVNAVKAAELGIVDICCDNSDVILRQYMGRFIRIPKDGIKRYKTYMNKINPISEDSRQKAINANIEMFSDNGNLQRIYEFSQNGIYPWEIK